MLGKHIFKAIIHEDIILFDEECVLILLIKATAEKTAIRQY